jgi:hypothetical protein
VFFSFASLCFLSTCSSQQLRLSFQHMTSLSVPSVSSLSHILLTDADWWIGCFLEERSLTNAMSDTLARFACELVLQDHGDDLQLGLFVDLLRRCERERVPFFVHIVQWILSSYLCWIRKPEVPWSSECLTILCTSSECTQFASINLCDFEHGDAIGQEDILMHEWMRNRTMN